MTAIFQFDPAAYPHAARRRLSVGAELTSDGVHFRVWAPERHSVSVVVESGPILRLTREGDGGCWSGLAPNLSAGVLYRYRLDDEERLFPDPASRWQPQGPHGPSEVIDPRGFAWRDRGWAGARLPGQVIYELHIGTFTPAGTWAAAIEKLPSLKAAGVTLLEVMPVASFPGGFGWGYDGVLLYAPYHGYGHPDDFRRFVDQAHAVGLAVILDVVYNHFGPDGNYLPAFSPHYRSKKATEWGDAVNFDGPQAEAVRQFVVENAGYWIDEFHLDGLRLDATQSLFDTSDDHIVAALTRRARAAAGSRSIVVVAENEPQDTRLVRPTEQGGHGIDGLWNDDLHHTAMVALTRKREAYYTDYLGSPQELISAAKYGYLFQGQRYHWQKQPRGTSTLGLPAHTFVAFLENHDQIANSARGSRLNQTCHPGELRAMTTLLLLGPWTPMLFQGQEWGSSRPFLYFADHRVELAQQVRKGRGEFLAQFPSCATPAVQEALADPAGHSTFTAAQLDWAERDSPRGQEWLALHQALLALRANDPTLRAMVAGTARLDGAVLGPHCLVLRFFAAGGTARGARVPTGDADRLLLVNLGSELPLTVVPEPLLAPPAGKTRWQTLLSSEDPRFGGGSAAELDRGDDGWHIPGAGGFLMGAI